MGLLSRSSGVWTALRVAVWTILAALGLYYLFAVLESYLIDEFYYPIVNHLDHNGGYIAYKSNDPNAVEPKTYLVYGYIMYLLLTIWLPLLALGLGVYLYAALPRGNKKAAGWAHKVKAKVMRVLTWPLPCQRFWLNWCGGMNLIEAAFYIFCMACLVLWTRYFIDSGDKYYNAIGDVIELGEKRQWLQLERWAITWGLVLIPCFLLLFWPCAHDSWVNHMLGLSWSHMIKYHRWVGHITMWVMTAHGVLYYILWAFEPGVNFWTEFSSWKESIPFFPGTLAWLFGIPLWVTSIYYYRRRFFEVFYKVHVVCFVGLIIFSCIHYAASWFYILPSLMPYMVDLAFRNAQSANVTTIVNGHVSEDGSIATIELALDPKVRACPAAEFFLNIPSISLWQWHPFTVARKTGNVIGFHIKSYGNFTKKIMKSLESGVALPVRVTGPVGLKVEHVLEHPLVLMVTGGVGVSPAMLMLYDLLERRARGDTERMPQRVRLVWVTRHKSEFTTLDERLLAAAKNSDGWLTIELFYTGSHLQSANSIKAPAIKEISDSSSASNTSEDLDTPDAKARAKAANTLGSAHPDGHMYFPWASPFGLAMARPVQPKQRNLGQAAAALLLGHIGAFFAFVLASAYEAEPSTVGRFGQYAGTVNNPYGYWRTGALYLLAGMIGGIGLPAFVIHPVSFISYLRNKRAVKATAAAGDGAELARKQSDALMQPTVVNSYASTLVGAKVGIMESDLLLDINAGRPDTVGLLERAKEEAACLGITSTIGVFVGGPSPMVKAMQEQCIIANRSRKKPAPFLDVYVDTWEM